MSEAYWKARAERLDAALSDCRSQIFKMAASLAMSQSACTGNEMRPSEARRRVNDQDRKLRESTIELRKLADSIAPQDDTPRRVDGGYDIGILSNPDHTAWARFFKKTFPDCGVDEDTMAAWFANAMMAKHDSMVQTNLTDDERAEALNVQIDRVLAPEGRRRVHSAPPPARRR